MKGWLVLIGTSNDVEYRIVGHAVGGLVIGAIAGASQVEDAL